MSEYYYLVSSLPSLEFGARPNISYIDFLTKCREQLNNSDNAIIEKAVLGPFEGENADNTVLKEWKRFEIALRNEIARERSSRSAKDPAAYMRGEGYSNPFESGFAHWAVNQESPLEAELYLDRVRWEKIEDISKFHYFDISFLISYALKLQILERWQRINKDDGAQVLQDLIKA